MIHVAVVTAATQADAGNPVYLIATVRWIAKQRAVDAAYDGIHRPATQPEPAHTIAAEGRRKVIRTHLAAELRIARVVHSRLGEEDSRRKI